MTEPALIDVIVPVYNGASYIPAFFDMFSAQADGRVRLLFVDDGSTDGSGDLLDGCAAGCGFPAKVIHRENGGVSAARNTGLDAAEGRYIAFFDVDDLAAPDYVSVLIDAVLREKPDVLVFAQERVTEADAAPAPPEEAYFVRQSAEEQLRAFLADPTRLGVYDLLVRRDFLEERGLRFPEGYKYYEDYDFLYRVFAGAKEILYTDRALYRYVLREGSAMGRFDGERLRCLALMRALEDFFPENVPDFAEVYRKWGTARIYWSVLWQAALAAPSFGDFRKFARETFARVWLRKLRGFPSRRVAWSSRLFLLSMRAYFAAARRLGGRRTNVSAINPEAYAAAAEGCPDPRRVLVYGMTDNPGGIESYLLGLLRRMPEGTFDFLCDFPSIAYADELAARGSLVHFIPAKSVSLFGHWSAAARVLREHPEYTAVYCNVLDAGCAFLAVIPWLHRRRVTVHSHNGDTDKKRLHRLCRPFLNRITSGRAACSDEASRHMFGRTGGDILFVPNAIDGARYAFDPGRRAAKRKMLSLDERLVICHVGRITRQKNPLALLDILAAVRAEGKRPDAVLLSVGVGDMDEEFDAAIREKGLEDAVLRLGRRGDVPELLQAADVFLLPSLYEGLSIALLEAQAAGLPCVTSDTISPQTIVTDAVRRISLDAGPETWAEAVLAAAEDKRFDAREGLIRAGFDISCCGENDRRLMELIWGNQ